MPRSSTDPSFNLRTECGAGQHGGDPNHAGPVQPAVSGHGGRSLREGIARMDGVIPAAGLADQNSRALSGGRQHASGTGCADGDTFRNAGGGEPGRGPRFDAIVPPGGYLWWYVDGLSDCGTYGLSVIAFVGSVFSPYYHWAGRRDPDNHVCINVALYAPYGNRWTMTERGRKQASRDAVSFQVGPSHIRRDGAEIVIEFDEVSVPRPPSQWLPKRVKGVIRFSPDAVTSQVFDIDAEGKHRWWPVSPTGRINAQFETGGDDWSGHGYMDSNRGTEPLEQGFSLWDWARGRVPTGDAVIIYDTTRKDGSQGEIAIRIGTDGEVSAIPMPARTPLPNGFWGVPRLGHHDPSAKPTLSRTLEDGPFYTRSVIRTRLLSETIDMMHESLSGKRFASPIVKAMLPFRMPRRAG